MPFIQILPIKLIILYKHQLFKKLNKMLNIQDEKTQQLIKYDETLRKTTGNKRHILSNNR